MSEAETSPLEQLKPTDFQNDPRFADFDQFAARLTATQVISDPWIGGHPRFTELPMKVDASVREELERASEAVATAYNELVLICHDNPDYVDSFFQLTPYQKAMWAASAPLWHTIARADCFFTEDGIQLTEINSDTPTGAPEAVVMNELVRSAHPDCVDPNAELESRFFAAVERVIEATTRGDIPRRVGVVYPTEHTEDLALIRLYRRWFEDAGWEVVYGSPYNLSIGPARETLLFDQPIGLMVRHYKSDWWGERTSPWDDDHFADDQPLTEPLSVVLSSMLARKLAVVNPFGAIIPQNKRAMAFFWENIQRFSHESQEAIRQFIPITSRLEVLHEEQLIAEKDDWVIKSDYGAEGDEVIIGRHHTDDIWEKSIAHAKPGRWVAQRYFESLTNEGDEVVNYGVFLVGGRASALYARAQVGSTDDHAISTPLLVKKPS